MNKGKVIKFPDSRITTSKLWLRWKNTDKSKYVHIAMDVTSFILAVGLIAFVVWKISVLKF